ncbi:MAG: hypothetical protein Phog2KO_38410 [Phototrophicaceae bacterium]
MYPDSFLDENQFILMAIESQVTNYYAEHPELVDYNVEKVYNSIQRVFEKEIQDKNPPKLRLKPREQELYDRIENVCRLYTGEQTIESEEADIDDILASHPVAKDTIVKCMKRLRSSIKTWTGNVYGQRGYLDYVSNFI